MSAHSPGPWRYLEDHDGDAAGRPLTVCDAANNDLAEVYSREDATVDISREQAIANARLIAAAPDLLDAAKEAMQWFDAEWKARVADHMSFGGTRSINIQKIRAAISRATVTA